MSNLDNPPAGAGALDANPFRPPSSAVADPPLAASDLRVAGKGRRFGTAVIDYIGFVVLGFALGIGIALLFGQAGIDALDRVPDIVLGVPILLCYYLFFEGIWARTPGKWVFGTIVVTEDGGKPELKRILGRTLLRFVPFEALTFFGKKGLHDSASKTLVVMARGR